MLKNLKTQVTFAASSDESFQADSKCALNFFDGIVFVSLAGYTVI